MPCFTGGVNSQIGAGDLLPTLRITAHLTTPLTAVRPTPSAQRMSLGLWSSRDSPAPSHRHWQDLEREREREERERGERQRGRDRRRDKIWRE